MRKPKAYGVSEQENYQEQSQITLHTPLERQSSPLIAGRPRMSFSHTNHSEMTKYFLELLPPQVSRNIPIPTEILAEQIKTPFSL